MNEFFLDQTQRQKDELVESPMFRYECCEHCGGVTCPRHDGHPDPCGICPEGIKMICEPK